MPMPPRAQPAFTRAKPLLAAQALLQDFHAIDHDPREDERLRRFLAAWAYRYSSMVSLEGDDAIVLEVERSLGLFGPWPRLERMLRDDLRDTGFPAPHRDGADAARRLRACRRAGWPGAHRTAPISGIRWGVCR